MFLIKRNQVFIVENRLIDQKQTFEKKILYFRAGAKTYLKKLAKVRPKNRTSENSQPSHKWSLFPDTLFRLARYIQKCSNTGFFFHFFRRKVIRPLRKFLFTFGVVPFLSKGWKLYKRWKAAKFCQWPHPSYYCWSLLFVWYALEVMQDSSPY